MARIITTLATLIAMGSTLVLPIYPEGIDPLILAFLAMAAIGAVFGLADRRARHELAVMAPWAVALLLGVLVGSLHHGEALQAIEDVLPYLLFVMGLVAGRGMGAPRRLLQLGLLVCVGDSVISLWLMESFGAGVRSTFTYYKITAGLPLVGLYLAAILRDTPEPGVPKTASTWVVHAVCVAMLVLGIVFSITRGMLLGALMAVAISGYVRKPSQALMVATVALFGLVVWSSAFAELGVEYLRLGQEGTIQGRFREVEIAWEGFVAAPLFGQGLGALADVDGFKKAFVHNMAAYHLWKFGLIGSGLIVVPLVVIARELRGHKRSLRAHALGAAAGILGYLITCAAYKTYYLVWIYGAVVGASLSHFAGWRDRVQAAAATPGRETLARGTKPSPS
jgi:hypothetical protein